MRLIGAARVFGQVIASERVGAGTGSAANLLVFADAALAFPLGGVAQRLEERAVAVNVGQRLVEHVAASDREETAGEDLALVRNKDEALAVTDAGGAEGDALGGFVLRGAVLGANALRHIAAVVHGLGGLDEI